MDVHVAPMFFLVTALPQILRANGGDANTTASGTCAVEDFTLLAAAITAATLAQFICSFLQLRSILNALFHCGLLIMMAASFVVVSGRANCLPPHADTMINIFGTGIFFLIVLINNNAGGRRGVDISDPVAHVPRPLAVAKSPRRLPKTRVTTTPTTTTPTTSSSSSSTPGGQPVIAVSPPPDDDSDDDGDSDEDDTADVNGGGSVTRRPLQEAK
jgi:hypothetical protein